LDTNIENTLVPGRGRSKRSSTRFIQRRIAKIADKYDVDTQRVRFELILELKALEELAQQRAIDERCADYKLVWVRVAAYVGQVVNSISKTYDEASVDAELKNLKKQVEELAKTKEESASQA
jgi:hypothetical protein